MMMDYAGTIYAVIAPLSFPEGFSIGSGNGKGNRLEIERNGEGKAVIRGTSIAGLLRSEVENDPRFNEDDDRYYFGSPLDKQEERRESRLHFTDTVFSAGSQESMHNLMSRHTGSVSQENKGLFSIEKTLPGAEADLFFTLRSDSTMADRDDRLIKFLAECLNGGILIGGNSNRGGGRCRLRGDRIFIRKFDMENADDTAAYLDLMYADHRKIDSSVEVKPVPLHNRFSVEISLRIPSGQDLLCSEGNDMFPVSVSGADGLQRWKIPGSTLRGIFKGWMSRLAAKDGEKLSDSADWYQTRGNRKEVEAPNLPDDPILDLFGSLEKKGRIHFSDAYSNRPVKDSDTRKRAHVVIDRFTGGTNDGKLFENSVLTAGDLLFQTEITIREAEEKEVRWLEKSLQALNLGLIRVGSSKASGRLEIAKIDVTANPAGYGFNTEMKEI